MNATFKRDDTYQPLTILNMHCTVIWYSAILDLTLTTDVSDIGISGVLSQSDHDGNMRPSGRGLSPAEKNYITTEKQMLAVIWSLLQCHVYLENNTV